MLTQVKAYSAWPSAQTLLLDDNGREETDLIQIRNIEGLEPVKAAINTSAFGSMDGSSYTGRSITTRNIVLTLSPNPDWDTWTYEKLRRLIYSYFMPGLLTRLVFYSEEIPPVEIYGYVEDTGTPMFVKDPEIQVSIICPDPYFTAVSPTIIIGTTSDGSSPEEIIYNGDIETGINVQVNPLPNLIDINFENSYFSIVTSSDLNKRYIMNSIPGSKYVQSVNLTTGLITNLLSKKVDGSTWPTLKPGTNHFAVVSDDIGNQDWTLTYFERYGGL